MSNLGFGGSYQTRFIIRSKVWLVVEKLFESNMIGTERDPRCGYMIKCVQTVSTPRDLVGNPRG